MHVMFAAGRSAMGDIRHLVGVTGGAGVGTGTGNGTLDSRKGRRTGSVIGMAGATGVG